MRWTPFLTCAALAACSNDVAPRLIAGGGIGDGSIDGRVNVTVIDGADAPVANATVRVGDVDKTTDEKGLAIFESVHGPQTISVKAEGFRSAAWVGANGANVTIPIEPAAPPVPDQATLSGTIAGWSTITVPQGHLKAGIVLYSQTDKLGDSANDIETPASGNVCGLAVATECFWHLAARTGPLTVIAMIFDYNNIDRTLKLIGWASRAVTVEKDKPQAGIQLAMIDPHDLQDVTIDLGWHASLPQTSALIGIEVSKDEVVQLPMSPSNTKTMLVPRPTVFGADATYRLTVTAQTEYGERGPKSIMISRGHHDATLAAGTWLHPPMWFAVTRTRAAFIVVPNAEVHTIEWNEAAAGGKRLLEITVFDKAITQVDVPPLVALPTSGALTARISGVGTDIDVHDFSLDEDRALLWGVASQPVAIP